MIDAKPRITAGESDQLYLSCLQKAGKKLHGKTLDVGCGSGAFVKNARLHYGAKESWGVEHTQAYIAEGFADGTLEECDKPHCLAMSFSQIPSKHPELKGTFDVIKITAVTPYASAEEMKQMAATAHQLLKKDGCVILELPWMNMSGKAFQANQSTASSISATASLQQTLMKTAQKKGFSGIQALEESTERFKDSYRQLFALYFGKIDEYPISQLKSSVIIAQEPRERIPDPKDIHVNPITMELKLGPSALAIQPAARTPAAITKTSILPQNIAKLALAGGKPSTPNFF